MALTIGEASAVFTLLRYVLDEDGPTGPTTPGQALAAAHRLRDKAHKTLAAGMQPESLDALWAPYAERTELERGLVAVCVVCGCTEDSACEGGCAWEPSQLGVDVCTACVEKLAVDAAKAGAR